MDDKNLSKRKEEEKKIEEEKKQEERKKEEEKRQEQEKEEHHDTNRFTHQEERSEKKEQEVSAPQPTPTPKRENEKEKQHRPQGTMKFLSGIENSLNKGHSADAILLEAKSKIQMMKDTKEHEERADLLKRADKFFEENLEKNGRDGSLDLTFKDQETGKRVEGHFENGQLAGKDALKIFDDDNELVEADSFDKAGDVTERFSRETGRTEIKKEQAQAIADNQQEQEKDEEKKAFDPSRRPSIEERKARLRQEIAEKEKGKEKGHEF